MRGEIQAALALAGGTVLLFGVACSGEAGPAQAQAHYTSDAPPQSEVPVEEKDKSCLEATGGIGADTPLVEGGRTGPPELPPVTGYPQNPGGPVQDGQTGPMGNGTYKLSCSVVGSDDGRYRINARLSAPMNDSEFAAPGSGATNIDILGATIGPDGKGSGRVDFYTSESLKVSPVSGVTCLIDIVPDPNTGDLVIAPGSAWLTFHCQGARSGDLRTYCWSSGSVVLNNCATE